MAKRIAFKVPITGLPLEIACFFQTKEIISQRPSEAYEFIANLMVQTKHSILNL